MNDLYAKHTPRTLSRSPLSRRKARAARAEAGVRSAEVEGSPRVRHLLRELEALFRTEGFLHLTIDDIARRLRCSKATLYRLATTREELYAAIVDRILANVREEGLAAARSAPGFPDALIGLLGAAVPAARDLSESFVRDMGRHPAARRCLLQHQRRRVADVEQLIAQGVAHGAFRPLHARLVAELLLPMMAKVFDSSFLSAVGLSLADAYAEAYQIIEFGIVPARAAARKGRRYRKAGPDPVSKIGI